MAARRVKSLRIGYGVSVEETLLPPIPQGWVLVKTISAAWDGIEEATATGLVWVKPGRVPGTQGYGIVVELGVGAPRILAGRRVVFSRLPRHDEVEDYRSKAWAVVEEVGPLPGTAYDGWLSEYTVMPASSLEIIDTSFPAEYVSIAASAAIAWAAARTMLDYGGSRISIMGAGPSALLASLALEEASMYYEVISRDMAWNNIARKMGVKIRKPKEIVVEPGRGYDAVFLATLDPDEAMLASSIVASDGLLLLHPIYSYVDPPRARKGCIKLLKSFPAQQGISMLSKIKDILDDLIEVVEGLEKPPIPRPKPFISYLVSSP